MAVFRRDPCGVICLIVTYTAVFYADYCLVEHVVVPTLSDSIWGVIHMFVFNVVVMLLLISHARASFSDPGVVPLPATSLDFSEIHKGKCSSKQGETDWTVCTRCEAYRPPRAHHCRTCNRCIKKMDHHCPWINNCVGEANQKYFILFLFYTGVASVYAGILAAVSWGLECMQCSEDYVKGTRVIHLIVLIVEALLFGLFVIAMMCDQCSSIMSDVTPVEQLQKQMRTRRPRTVVLSEVFGRGSLILWLCPCSTPGMTPDRQLFERYTV